MSAGRAVLYTRQSITRDDDSLSLETQERLLRDLAAARGWAVAAVFPDPDRRGWDEDRPGLRDALDRCEAGGIAAFCVYDTSRLARKVRLQEQIVDRLAALGIELVSYREPHAGTPLFRQILGAIAEEQTRTISANWRRVLAGRTARGLSHGVVPYGYAKPVPGGPIVPNPEAAGVVAGLFARYADGWHVADLAVDLTRRGIRAPRGGAWWATQTVAQILDNPVYTGFVVLNGERVAGQHAPIVDAATWDAVAARRATGARPFRHKPCSSWLEGHVWHACGAKMHLQCTGAAGHGEKPRFRCWRVSHRHTPEGPCPLHPTQIPAYRAEPLVRAILAADLDALLPMSAVIAQAKAQARAEAPAATDRRRDLDGRAARATDRRHKAEELYLSGVRDRPWFDAQDASVAAELADVERELAALPHPPALADIRDVGAGLRRVSRLVLHAPDEAMGAVLAEVGIVVVEAGGCVRVVYHAAVARHLGRDEAAEGVFSP